MLRKDSHTGNIPAEVYPEKETELLLSDEMAVLCFADLQYSVQCLLLSKEEEAKDSNILITLGSMNFFDIVHIG